MFEKFRKLGNKGIYLSIAFIVILFAIIWGILSINTGEKTPVDSQRVYEEIINLGYEPIDTTSLYIEDDSNLQKSVTTKKSVLISLNLIMTIVQLMCITMLVLKCTLIKVVI